MIKRLQSISLLKNFPAKKAIKKSVITIELAGAAAIMPLSAKYSGKIEKLVFQTGDKFIEEKNFYNAEEAQKLLAQVSKLTMLRNNELTKINRQKLQILKVIREDKNCCSSTDKKKLAEEIVRLSNEYGANPVHIACIAKKESHFTENVNKGPAKGLMQITKIAVKDMYQRPHLYHTALADIKKEYPTYEALFSAIQLNSELNLRVGIIAFLQRLEKANGNVEIALQNYNGSSRKIAYAHSIMKDIKKYAAEYKELKNSSQKPA